MQSRYKCSFELNDSGLINARHAFGLPKKPRWRTPSKCLTVRHSAVFKRDGMLFRMRSRSLLVWSDGLTIFFIGGACYVCWKVALSAP